MQGTADWRDDSLVQLVKKHGSLAEIMTMATLLLQIIENHDFHEDSVIIRQDVT